MSELESRESFLGRFPSLTSALEELRSGWLEAGWLESQDVPAELFHYCGVEGFYGIVTTRTLWLSDVLTMNDASEVLYAREVVDEALRSYSPHPVWLPTGIIAESAFLDLLASSWRMYVSCFCSRGDLLSQWRGYGAGGGGFAIGFDAERLRKHAQNNQTTNPFPMLYDPEEQKRPVLNLIRRACEIVAKHQLSPDDYKEFRDEFVFPLTTYMPQAKNPSFKEEIEWRLLRISPSEVPKFRPAHGIIVPYIELANIPHDVFKSVTLGPAVEPKFGLHPTKLFLENNGMAHVEVRLSEIPLRVVAQ
jgi:hypothetical protein